MVFDPLSYENLGESIARALDSQPVVPLTELAAFDGAGIYALYYTGDLPIYSVLSKLNRVTPGSLPIYVGKAESENSRKGDPNQNDVTVIGRKLFNRIQTHKKSISLADNLNVEDFQVRYLTVTPTWVPLAEVVALRIHRPIWNSTVDGLGNHDPGKGRRAGARPRWDTIHPGRPWAEQLAERSESIEEISSAVEIELNSHLEKNSNPDEP